MFKFNGKMVNIARRIIQRYANAIVLTISALYNIHMEIVSNFDLFCNTCFVILVFIVPLHAFKTVLKNELTVT